MGEAVMTLHRSTEVSTLVCFSTHVLARQFIKFAHFLNEFPPSLGIPRCRISDRWNDRWKSKLLNTRAFSYLSTLSTLLEEKKKISKKKSGPKGIRARGWNGGKPIRGFAP